MSRCRYWGLYPNTTTLADINKFFKPYKYGHATEMTAYANGSYRSVCLCITGLLLSRFNGLEHGDLDRICWSL